MKKIFVFTFLLICTLSMTSCLQPALSEPPTVPEPETPESTLTERAEIIPEPLGQTAALHAYDQIMIGLGALLTEAFPQKIKALFTEYPIIFYEEDFTQPA